MNASYWSQVRVFTCCRCVDADTGVPIPGTSRLKDNPGCRDLKPSQPQGRPSKPDKKRRKKKKKGRKRLKGIPDFFPFFPRSAATVMTALESTVAADLQFPQSDLRQLVELPCICD